MLKRIAPLAMLAVFLLAATGWAAVPPTLKAEREAKVEKITKKTDHKVMVLRVGLRQDIKRIKDSIPARTERWIAKLKAEKAEKVTRLQAKLAEARKAGDAAQVAKLETRLKQVEVVYGRKIKHAPKQVQKKMRYAIGRLRNKTEFKIREACLKADYLTNGRYSRVKAAKGK